MIHPPKQDEAHLTPHGNPQRLRFRSKCFKIEKLCEEANQFGVDYRGLGLLLLSMSEDVAKKGGPLVHFDHALWVEEQGKRMLADFEKQYEGVLDFDELIQGNVVNIQSDTVN